MRPRTESERILEIACLLPSSLSTKTAISYAVEILETVSNLFKGKHDILEMWNKQYRYAKMAASFQGKLTVKARFERIAALEKQISEDCFYYNDFSFFMKIIAKGELREKILELKEKLEKKYGDKFDIRRFHDAVLRNGSVPLYEMEKEVLEEFKDNKAS